MDEIDRITNEEFLSIVASVDEEVIDNKINLKFIINETDKTFVERINIFGNNVTRENVIRNQLIIDEGDPYNEILKAKSINNLKSLNFFKSVQSEVIDGKDKFSKIINIFVDEKPTGEISAGAGVGTSGGTVTTSIKENNYLGKGIALEASATVDEESLKGFFSVTNPNFNNTDKLLSLSIEAIEIDRIKDFGYKNNKIGFSIGTEFEYLDDLNLGLSTSSFYERIDTDNTASARQKKQEGNYFDTFFKINFDLDKRDQKFQTSDGYRSRYFLDLPILSETYTLSNTLDYSIYTELYEQNITSASFLFKSAHSLKNKDIKLSERLFIPSRRLRGFQKGKVGPLDGNDFIGGNYISTINLKTNLPHLSGDIENIDFGLFLDVANVWGVDYDSSLEKNNNIKSSIGLGMDWFTLIGPINFSFAMPITKDESDKTETFRFNLGTTF